MRNIVVHELIERGIGDLDVLSYAEQPLRVELTADKSPCDELRDLDCGNPICHDSRDMTFERGRLEYSRADGSAEVRFASAIVLTKNEVFDACDGLARARRLLVADGHADEADWAALLFEDLEGRLSVA